VLFTRLCSKKKAKVYGGGSVPAQLLRPEIPLQLALLIERIAQFVTGMCSLATVVGVKTLAKFVK
jgi:hypothetical protein